MAVLVSVFKTIIDCFMFHNCYQKFSFIINLLNCYYCICSNISLERNFSFQ
jgi:hypothetical protein